MARISSLAGRSLPRVAIVLGKAPLPFPNPSLYFQWILKRQKPARAGCAISLPGRWSFRGEDRKDMATRLRVGAVSYLNAKPLYYGLADAAPGVSLSMDVPSRLADRLAEGELDVALIPSVEYLR